MGSAAPYLSASCKGVEARSLQLYPHEGPTTKLNNYVRKAESCSPLFRQPREACQPTSRPCPVSCQETETGFKMGQGCGGRRRVSRSSHEPRVLTSKKILEASAKEYVALRIAGRFFSLFACQHATFGIPLRGHAADATCPGDGEEM